MAKRKYILLLAEEHQVCEQVMRRIIQNGKVAGAYAVQGKRNWLYVITPELAARLDGKHE